MTFQGRTGFARRGLGFLGFWVGLAAASPAPAAVFAVVQSGPDEITVLDPAAVKALPGGGEQREAWTVSIKRDLVSGGPKQSGYVRTLNQYDCVARRVRWRSFFVYSRFGDLMMHKDNDDAAWEGKDADPGLRTVCGDMAGSAVVSAASLSQLVIGLMQTWDESAPAPPVQPATPPAPAKKVAGKARP